MSTQLIWVCDHYEVADDRNSEVPAWPVQDAGGRWRHEGFDGQRVAYSGSKVDFGVKVEPIVIAPGISPDDFPDNVYLVSGTFYQEV